MASFGEDKLSVDMGMIREWQKHPRPIPPPAPQKFQEKELIILALYIQVGNQSWPKGKEILQEWRSILKIFTDRIEAETKYKISCIILPQKEGENRLECIFPKNSEELDMSIFSKITEENLLP